VISKKCSCVKYIVITGPTATGKTDAAVALAKKLNGEIISADSMQIYKFMDIGTAKPSVDERGEIPHYLIDELMPDEEYSVAHFAEKAKHIINEATAKGKLPIVAGGTGFYINALVKSTDFTPVDSDDNIRNELYRYAEIHGNSALHDRLKIIDAASAELIHENNKKRVVRAIEYFQLTGKKISEHNALEFVKEQDKNVPVFMLDLERDMLYERINARVDCMIERGLVNEVSDLLNRGFAPSLTSMQGLGYKEIVRHLNGEISLDEAINDIKVGTRRFAKRQLTWFRNKLRVERIDVTGMNTDEAAEVILACMTKY
jgi:tRNA dimethylallyltransferase